MSEGSTMLGDSAGNGLEGVGFGPINTKGLERREEEEELSGELVAFAVAK